MKKLIVFVVALGVIMVGAVLYEEVQTNTEAVQTVEPIEVVGTSDKTDAVSPATEAALNRPAVSFSNSGTSEVKILTFHMRPRLSVSGQNDVQN